jgi:hypothetical protein
MHMPTVLTMCVWRCVSVCVAQMSDALDLSSWATCRLVSGVPSLINVNYDTLRNRCVCCHSMTWRAVGLLGRCRT